jgi:hypothetical protein
MRSKLKISRSAAGLNEHGLDNRGHLVACWISFGRKVSLGWMILARGSGQRTPVLHPKKTPIGPVGVPKRGCTHSAGDRLSAEPWFD